MTRPWAYKATTASPLFLFWQHFAFHIFYMYYLYLIYKIDRPTVEAVVKVTFPKKHHALGNYV